MNAPAKPSQRRERIRLAIRHAAIEEFAINGLAGASTQAIAQRAGLSKPQLHYYINSKEDLYEEVLVFIIGEWRSTFFFSADSDDPEKVIRGYIRRKIEYSRRHPAISRVFTNEVVRGAPILRKHWALASQDAHEAANLIQKWIDAGRIDPIDPLLFLMHIWAVTQHYADYEAQIRFMLDVEKPAELNWEHIIEEVTRLFVRSCGVPAATVSASVGARPV